MRILLVPNTDNPRACAAARDLVGTLSADGHSVGLSQADAVGCGLDGVHGGGSPELAVALGGDGTVLKAAHVLAGADVPVLGINLGRLGFLCGADGADPLGAVRAVIAGEAREERRSTLSVSTTVGGRATGVHDALNEVFIGRSAGARAVDLAIEIDGQHYARWVCDGLIVSTPTGSTAYALSAGGPLVAPALRALLVVPVCPHTLDSRPLVLDEASEITVTLPDPARSDACVIVDGDPSPCRGSLDRVDIVCGPHDVRLLRLDGLGFAAGVRDAFLRG